MIIFTPCWGQPYIDWLKRGLMESLKWPQNYRAVSNARWEIFTSAADYEEVKNLPFPIETSVTQTDGAYHSLLPTIEKCILSNQPMLMATADMIFSDGSIETFKRYGNGHGIAVSMAHVRVLPGFLSSMTLLKNSSVVTRAWEYLHDSWVFAEVGMQPTNSYQSGVCWRYLARNVVGVQHRLPTVFYINFFPSDLDHLKRSNVFNAWDTYFPGECLVQQGRNRVIGSSDAAFVVELTEAHMNVPGREQREQEDAYHMDFSHNRMNRQFVTIFRMD